MRFLLKLPVGFLFGCLAAPIAAAVSLPVYGLVGAVIAVPVAFLAVWLFVLLAPSLGHAFAVGFLICGIGLLAVGHAAPKIFGAMAGGGGVEGPGEALVASVGPLALLFTAGAGYAGGAISVIVGLVFSGNRPAPA